MLCKEQRPAPSVKFCPKCRAPLSRRALQCDKGQNAVYIVLLVSCGVLGILDCRRKKGACRRGFMQNLSQAAGRKNF